MGVYQGVVECICFGWVTIGSDMSLTCLLVLFSFLILSQKPLLLTDTHSVCTCLILYPTCDYESTLAQYNVLQEEVLKTSRWKISYRRKKQ